jgi:hypothetical protein
MQITFLIVPHTVYFAEYSENFWHINTLLAKLKMHIFSNRKLLPQSHKNAYFLKIVLYEWQLQQHLVPEKNAEETILRAQKSQPHVLHFHGTNFTRKHQNTCISAQQEIYVTELNLNNKILQDYCSSVA